MESPKKKKNWLRLKYEAFFRWYERHYFLNLSIATALFTLQLIHLYWLAADVIAVKLTGQSFLPLSGIFQWFILVVDYTEIPALIAISLVYIAELSKKVTIKSILFLVLLLSQFLHIFWITDEFVIEHLVEHSEQTVLPIWLAWTAILIDYAEVPVIFDTIKKVIIAIKRGRLKEAGNALKERD